MIKFFAGLGIGICIVGGGLWLYSFIEEPSVDAILWVGLMCICILINIPAAFFIDSGIK